MLLNYKAPCIKMDKIENLWLQLSNVACNIKCKHCYLNCHQDTRKRNFLPVDKIQKTLNFNLPFIKKIYITGGEPFLHPKINDILYMCLKKADTVIYSNGTLLSEKKLNVLKQIESHTNNKIIFKLSLDHFTEGRNDEYRARGVFKKVIKALGLLDKLNFQANLICVNLKNDDENILKEGFMNLFTKYNLKLNSNNLKIIPMLNIGNYAKYYNISQNSKNVTFEDVNSVNTNQLDCKNSRVLTIDGIYSCPALVSDPRGKLGDEILSCNSNVYLETETCYNCIKRNDHLFC